MVENKSTVKIYVNRDEKNRIVAVSHIALPGFVEESIMLDSDLQKFISELNASVDPEKSKQQAFLASDIALIRVLEDLIEILIDKNIIQLTELPDAAQQKLLMRKKIRDTVCDLLGGETDKDYTDINI